jgi:hypothetical protein
MINEVVSPFDQHRARELTQAVAMMQISAKEHPAAPMQNLVSMREELCVVSGEQLRDGQLTKDLLNALSFEFEVTRRMFRDDEAPGLHRVQREVTDEYNAIKNRQLGAGKEHQMHAFAAEDRTIRFPDARTRTPSARVQDRPVKCFVCDGAHYALKCSWLPAVRDMVKNALAEGLSRPAAAAAVAEGKLQIESDEDDECADDQAYAIAADAGDPYANTGYEDEDWLHNIAT